MADDARIQRPVNEPASSGTWKLWIAWPFVLIPLLLGFSQTVIKAAAMFR